LTLDLSDVELVVTASNADGSASADSNAFTVGLTERYSARITALLTTMSSFDAWDEYKFNRKGGPFGANAVPEAETFDVAADEPISLQIWSEDFSSLRGLTLQSNVTITFILRLENATVDFVSTEDDSDFYTEYFDSSMPTVKTSADPGYDYLQPNEYWISLPYQFTDAPHGVDHSASLLTSLAIIPTGEGPVSADLRASADARDGLLERRFNDESHAVDASQVEIVNASTAASSAAVLSNAEIAAAETTETRAAVLRDVLIANNVADGQGAIYVAAESTAALLINATVVDNDAAGAAFVSAANGSQAIDSIFVGNGAAVSGVELQTVLTDDGAEGAIAYDASKPLFADADNGDYALAKNAQVIDLATGSAASETDLAGAARVSGTAADLGAYEYQGAAPSAPTDVKFGAYDAANQSATLTWADVADETGYRVEVKNADGSWTLVETLDADATAYVATGLVANGAYEYRVSAFNNFGASAAVDATVSTLVVPNAPTGLVFTKYDAANAKLTMKWVDNADNESIYVAVALVGSEKWKTEKLDADATGCVFTSVDPTKSYVFRVYASNAAGDSEYIEATFNASTDVLTGLSFSTDAPKVGEELSITVAPTTANVALQWFRVDADGSETAIEGATAATYTPTNADLGFALKVVATGLNAAYASTVSATTGAVEVKLTAPAAPTDVKFGAYDAASQNATLTWVDKADNEAGYKVEAKVDGAWKVVATLDADATSYVAEGLTAGTTYEYRVSAFNDAGSSASVEATITTPKDEEPEPQTPNAPSNLVFGAYDAANNALPMSWTDNSDNETAFVVQYSVDGGKTWLASATMKANETERVASYVWANKEYKFRVCARNAEGASDWVYASFDARVDVLTSPTFSTDAPALDEAIAAVFASETANATFQWYRVEADGSETLIEGATNAEYQPTAADVGLRLKVVATSANPAYAATVSAVSEVVLETARFQPTAPTNVVFSNYDPATQKMSMAWDDNSNNEKYFEIEYRKDTGNSAGIWRSAAKVGRNVEGRVCSMVYGDTNFEFRVRAVYEYVDESGETVKLYSDWAEASFQYGRDVVTSVELSTDAPQVGVEMTATVPDRVVEATQGGKPVSVDATFQWYRVVEGVATPIEGATGATYVPTLDDVGCQLQAVAMSANVAYVSSAASTTAEVVDETADSRPVPPSGIVFGQYDPETDTLPMSWTNNSEIA
ncbi:MAG: fibronectin type III domain-containing protein, partial [Thermoguttaceae bacterium]|nr:fibronectin type III domain-containing protein [Thermoguttaceae bacterium]